MKRPVAFLFIVLTSIICITCINDYYITFNTNGADRGTPPEKTLITEATSIPSNSGELGKEGYYFECWNSNSSGTGIDFYPGAFFNYSTNIELYAKWRKIPIVNIGDEISQYWSDFGIPSGVNVSLGNVESKIRESPWVKVLPAYYNQYLDVYMLKKNIVDAIISLTTIESQLFSNVIIDYDKLGIWVKVDNGIIIGISLLKNSLIRLPFSFDFNYTIEEIDNIFGSPTRRNENKREYRFMLNTQTYTMSVYFDSENRIEQLYIE